MREIKFRFVFGVGDEVRFKLLSIDEALNCHFAQDEMAEQINEDLGVTDDEGAYEFELMSKDQFTGLTDINGVEIYESDIAQCDRGLLWVIKFINGCFMACNPVDENDYCMIDDYPLAVVGNEHQNPELMREFE